MTIHRQLDLGLKQLHEQLLIMGGYVEQALENATIAWRQRTVAKVQEVYSIEKRVNEAHLVVDDLCFKLLALQGPLAADLRTIVASIKINSDLERMVDLAVNIANNTEYYLKTSPLIEVTDLSLMSDNVRMMVKDVLDAFVESDIAAAEAVLLIDDKVDDFKRKIVSDVVHFINASPAAAEQGLNVILMAKNLERIGDHATNIAEDIIFTISGDDIRHSGRAKRGSGG